MLHRTEIEIPGDDCLPARNFEKLARGPDPGLG
jgi:hypothetical protein